MLRAILGLLFALGLMAYLGYGFLRLVLARTRKGERRTLQLSLSLPLGMGLLCVGMIGLSLAGIQYSFVTITLLLIPAFVAHLGARAMENRRGGRDADRMEQAAGVRLLPMRVSAILLIIVATIVFAATFVEPIAEVDAIAHWAFHAKVFFQDRTAIAPFLTKGGAGAGVSHWPPLLPLVQTWSHIAMGEYDDRAVKLIFPVFYLALLGILFGVLRRWHGRENAFALLLLPATLPALIMPFPAGSVASAYADLPMALFLAAACGPLLAWTERRERGQLLLAALIVAGALWVKREGIAFATVSIAAVWLFGLFNRERRQWCHELVSVFLFTGIVASSLLIQVAYKNHFPGPFSGESIDPTLLLRTEGIGRLLRCARYMAIEAANPSRWGFLWLLLGLLFLLRLRRLGDRTILLLLTLLAGQIAAALIGMAVSEFSPERIARLDMRRFLIQVAPIATIAIGMLVAAPGRRSPLNR